MSINADDSMKSHREMVHDVVDGELDYQEKRWNASTTVTEGKHTTGEFLGFMRAYLRKAEDAMTFQGEPEASDEALHIVRKITALGFSCMMQNGAPERQS